MMLATKPFCNPAVPLLVAILSVWIAMSGAGPARAQDAPGVTAASRQVLACRTVADAMARLACFENAAGQLDGALSLQSAVTADVPAVANATPPVVGDTTVPAPGNASPVTDGAPPSGRRLLPGWFLRSGNDVREKKDKSLAVVDITLTRIVRNNIGRHFFTTTDGHVWKQIRISTVTAPSSLPVAAQLRKTFSGQIRLKIKETGRSYPVRRIE